MQYNPQNTSSGPQPGTYQFRIEDAVEKKFKSSNTGVEVAFQVFIEGRYFTYTPKGQGFLQKFMEAIGLDFNNPPATNQEMNPNYQGDDPGRIPDMIGKSGTAHFQKGKDGYLNVSEYLNIPASQSIVGSNVGMASSKPPLDDVPF